MPVEADGRLTSDWGKRDLGVALKVEQLGHPGHPAPNQVAGTMVAG